MDKIAQTAQIKTLFKEVVLIGLIFVAAASIVFSILQGAASIFSISIGYIMAVSSFMALVFTILNLNNADTKKATISGILGITKMLVLGMGLWFLISYKVVSPVAFLFGFSSFVAALLIESIRIKKRNLVN